MLFQLIGALMVGVLAACLAFIAHKVSRGRIPRVVIPFMAAFAMIAYSVWTEATWYRRTVAVLPKDFVVVEHGKPVSSPFSPWTYIVPRTDSFDVVNMPTVQPLPGSTVRFLAQVHRISRYVPTQKKSVVVDCKSGEQAEIVATTKFDASGLPNNLEWAGIGAGNHIAEVICPK